MFVFYILFLPLFAKELNDYMLYISFKKRYTGRMERLKKLCSIALATFALGGMGLTPAEAVYKPKITSKMNGQFTKDVQKMVTILKTWPKQTRWAFIAEKLGLLFMPSNGDFGNEPSHGWIQDGSHFIGVDGVEYDTKAEYEVRPKNPDTWQSCADNLTRLGREVIFSRLSAEVTALVLKNAKYQLDKMAEEQPERRDMYLAYLDKLCYLPDGKSPYEKMESKTGPHKQPIQYYELGGKGCMFVDTEGTEHNFDDITRKYVSLGGARWTILNVCAHHVGRKDILDLYPDEVKKLRTNYKKKMKEIFTSKDSIDTDKKCEEQIVTNPNTATAVRLRAWPQRAREAWIVERLGLTFMPDGSSPVDHRNWTRSGAHYIGTDGMEYDWWQSSYYQQDRNEWDRPIHLMSQEGEGVWIDLQEEVNLLKKMYEKHAPVNVR